jgi:hypothetical protein
MGRRSYANNVYLLGQNISMIKKNTEYLLEASKGVDLEINSETKYRPIFMHKIMTG